MFQTSADIRDIERWVDSNEELLRAKNEIFVSIQNANDALLFHFRRTDTGEVRRVAVGIDEMASKEVKVLPEFLRARLFSES
jgi:hypothetical protein